MWSSTQNDATISQPLPESTSLLDRTARLVAQKGLEFEERIMATYVNNAKYSFLRSSDPCHKLYEEKLAKYLPPKRPPALPSSSYIGFSYPPGISLKELGIIKLTAQFTARYVGEFLVALMKTMDKNPQFDFLKSTDRRFSFYCGLVIAYTGVFRKTGDYPETVLKAFLHRLQLEKLDKGVEMATIDLHAFTSGVDCFTYMEDDFFPISMPPPGPLSLMITNHGMLDSSGMLVRPPLGSDAHECVGDAAQPHLEPPFLWDLPRRPLCHAWITLKDLGIIKLTAMFVARYGMDLLKSLDTTLFQFMNPGDRWFYSFNLLVDAYSRVLRPLKEPKTCTDSVLKCFFDRLQLDNLDDGVEKGMIDLHAFVGGVDCFAHMEDEEYSARLPQPVHLSVLMNLLKQVQPPLGSQLTECPAQNQDGPQDIQPGAQATHECLVTQLDLVPLRELEPRQHAFSLPARITLKELGIIKFTAQFVARYGVELRKRVVMYPQFEFMKPNDSRFCFFDWLVDAYSRVLRLSKDLRKSDGCADTVVKGFFHCLQLEKLEKGVEMAMIDLYAFLDGIDCFARMEDDEYAVGIEHLSMLLKQLKPPLLMDPPPRRHDIAFRNPAFIRLKELGIIMLTAQFVARYGMDLMEIVVTNPQFEFMEPSDRRFYYFSELVDMYSGVLKPSKKLWKSDACAATVLECFFDRLQLDKLEEGVEMAVIDLHAFLDGIIYFTDTFDDVCTPNVPPPGRLSVLINRLIPDRPGMLVQPPDGATEDSVSYAQPNLEPPPFTGPPLRTLRCLTFTLPAGITLEEIGIFKVTAQFVARYGMELMKSVVKIPHFVFMEPTHRWFSFFNDLVDEYSRVLKPSKKLSKAAVLECFYHCLQLDKLDDGVEMALVDLHAFVSGVDYFFFMEYDEYSDEFAAPEYLSRLMDRLTQMRPPLGSHRTECEGDAPADPEPPHLCYQTRRPLHSLALAFPVNLAVEEIMTVGELGIMKLAAQFVARYGMDLMERVVIIPQFEFMKPTHSRFSIFDKLVNEYSRVLKRCKKLRKSKDAVLEWFCYCLQLNRLEEGVEMAQMAMIDLHAFLSGVDCFTHMEDEYNNRDDEKYSDSVPPPEHLSMLINLVKKQPGLFVWPPPACPLGSQRTEYLGAQNIQPDAPATRECVGDAQHDEHKRKRRKRST